MRVRELVDLHRTRGRREQGRHLVEGARVVAEAVRAGVVEEVLATTAGRAAPSVPADVQITEVADHVMERLSRATTPPGVVAVARSTTVPLEQILGDGLLVVLHEVADPGNAGAIIRTADAAGAAGVVLSTGSVDVFGPKCVRAAAGSTYHLPLVTGVSTTEVADACRGVGQTVVGLDADGPTSVRVLEDRSSPLAMVLGNEAHGLPAEVRAAVDELVHVPIHGSAESLNVAAAAAVALYAAVRGLRKSS